MKLPMSKPIAGQLSSFGINQIYGVVRGGPGVDEVFAEKRFTDVFGCAGVVDDGIAFWRESDTDDEVSVGSWAIFA